MVYSSFLQQYIQKNISLTDDNFKIALFTSKYSPNMGVSLYKDISLSGELVGAGYTKGGQDFTFEGPFELALENALCYKGQNVVWKNLTYQNVRYAVIYRVPKDDSQLDYLVAYFDFGDDKMGTNRTFTLAWKDTYVISLVLNDIGTGSYSSVEVDDKLSSTSTNPLQNRLITKALKAMGIRLDDETLEGDLEELYDADNLTSLSSSDISQMFDEDSTPDPEPEPDPDNPDDPSGKVTVDDTLSYDSSNAIANKTATSSLATLGVLLNGESLTEDKEVLEGYVDSMRGLESSEIDALFGKSTPIYITYIVNELSQAFVRTYSVNSPVSLPTVLVDPSEETPSDVEWYSNSNFLQSSRIGQSKDEVSIKRNMTLYGRLFK